MAVQMSFTLKDFGFSKRLKDKIRRISDMSGAMRRISFFMWTDVMRHFAREEGPTGKWAPIRRRGKILQDTGRLKASIKPRAGRKEAIVETDVPYARKHQEGIGVKQRQFLWLSPRSQKTIAQALMDWVIHGASRI